MSLLSPVGRLLLLFGALLPALHAQTFHFRDGRRASMPEAKIQGTNIVIPITISGGGSAEITLPISSLRMIEWPAPPELAAAEADLAAGRHAEALRKIEPILGEQEPFREIPGSWWAQGAVVKAVALAHLGRDVDATVLMELLRRAQAPAEVVNRVEMALIGRMIATGQQAQAGRRIDALREAARDDETLAALAIAQGRLLEQAGEHEAALLTFLRVPVFTPHIEAQMPAALLGAVRALENLGDDQHAATFREQLRSRYPRSPETAQLAR